MWLGRHPWHVDRYAHPAGNGIDGLLPGPLEVVAFGPQRFMWIRPKLERHPFDLNIFSANCFLKRKLREVAKRSDIIRVNLDLDKSAPVRSAAFRTPVDETQGPPFPVAPSPCRAPSARSVLGYTAT